MGLTKTGNGGRVPCGLKRLEERAYGSGEFSVLGGSRKPQGHHANKAGKFFNLEKQLHKA